MPHHLYAVHCGALTICIHAIGGLEAIALIASLHGICGNAAERIA